MLVGLALPRATLFIWNVPVLLAEQWSWNCEICGIADNRELAPPLRVVTFTSSVPLRGVPFVGVVAPAGAKSAQRDPFRR